MHNDQDSPPCFAIVPQGLEETAAEELRKDFKAEIRKTGQGLVVFRVRDIDRGLLQARTTDDVFVLAWGTDRLSYRAADLDKIRQWTHRDADWDGLLKLHHAVRPKPKGKPTYRLVVQMTGQHGYRRADAAQALARGLGNKLPASWRYAEENAAVEIWLIIHGATAVCGLRLSDRSMRHRDWKVEHIPASLRPTVAAAMVRVAELRPELTVLDPMCGAGTILGEAVAYARRRSRVEHRPWPMTFLGGDADRLHVRATLANLRMLEAAEEVRLETWDVHRRLPIPNAGVDRVITNPPFGKQLASPEEIVPLYQALVRQVQRVLKPGGIAVFLVAEVRALDEPARAAGWKPVRRLHLRTQGQRATILAYRKPE